MQTNKIYQGDSLEVLKTFPDESINCVMTSPPYWALRDYGVSGQLGLEPFFGAGTTGLVALKQGKRFVGIELNKKYIKIAKARLKPIQTCSL